MMTTIDRPITFAGAHITGEKVSPELHHAQTVKRGHLDFVMSRGELMKFAACPAKWIANAPEDESSFMAWGDLIDCSLLVPEQLPERFAVCPETYPDKKTGEPKPWNFNADFCKQWRDDQEDKTVIKSDHYSEAQAALSKLRNNPEIKSILTGARVQVSLSAVYTNSDTGLTIPIRALPDIVPSGEFFNSLVDLKTTGSAETRTWSRKVDSDNLDAQAALYLDVWNAATGEGRTDFRHIVQESNPPYHVELRLLSAEFIELGRLKYQHALSNYCQCLKSNQWPGYPSNQRFGNWSIIEPEAWMVR